MCLKFDAWCCFGAVTCPEDDYCDGPSAKAIVMPPPPHHHHHPVPAKTTHQSMAQRDGHHGNGHMAPHRHYPLMMPVAAAADEEDRKASNDLRRGGHGYGYAAGAAYVYSGPEDTVKQMTRNTTKVVADGERRDGAHCYPARGGDNADHHYPATATTIASIADYGRV